MNERFRASLSVNVIIISIIVSFYLSFLQKHWMTKKSTTTVLSSVKMTNMHSYMLPSLNSNY